MQKIKVDWDKIINKSIIDKVEHIFEALKWTMEEIKPPKIKKVRKAK